MSTEQAFPPFDPATIGDDTPIRLKYAVAMAFPDGSVTASSLRTEHRRGNLAIETIAGKHFVTLKAIKDMREKCRESQKGLASTCGAEKDVSPSGLSSTEQLKLAQAAAREISQKLKKPSSDTSSRSTGRTGEKAIPPK